MGKDLLSDRYGRYFEIPEKLAGLGHQVAGISISYRYTTEPEDPSGLVTWSVINALPFPPLLMHKFLARSETLIESSKPDIIWAGSDVIHCILASVLSRRYNIPAILDLYDNYEAYKLTRTPTLRRLFITACHKAVGITTVGERLKQYIETNYGIDSKRAYVLRNAINNDLFRPICKTSSRKALDLPQSAKLIGTAGALTKERGINVVFDAFIQLADIYEDIYLVLAGQRDRTLNLYNHPRIIDLGILPLEQVPIVLNALDVAIISNIRSSFGEYCFPQKFFEITSCGTPLVASDVGEMSIALATHPNMKYSVGRVDELKNALVKQLQNPQSLTFGENNTWSDRAIELENFFSNML